MDNWQERLKQLRDEIDICDEQLLDVLVSRMKAVEKVGLLKKENNVQVFQKDRWDNMRKALIEKARDKALDEELIEAIFDSIHESSVRMQRRLMEL